MMRRPGLWVLTTVLAISACAPAQRPAGGDESPSSGASPEQGVELLSLADATRAEAGRQYTHTRLITGRAPGGRFRAPLALTPRGELVVSTFGRNASGPHSFAVEIVGSHGVSKKVPIPADHPASNGITRMAAGPRWLVWQTAESRDLLQDQWVLWSFDRQRNHLLRLAKAPKTVSGHYPRLPLDSPPAVTSQGRVFVSAARERRKGKFRLSVESIPAGGGVLRFEEAGTAPFLGRDRLVWASSGTGPPRVQERSPLFRGPAGSLFAAGSNCERGLGLTAAGDTTAWAVQCGPRATVAVASRGEVIAEIRVPLTVGHLAATSRFVSFSTGSGPYRIFVFDLDERHLYEVGGKNLGGETFVAGSDLAWVEFDAAPPTPGTVRLITWR